MTMFLSIDNIRFNADPSQCIVYRVYKYNTTRNMLLWFINVTTKVENALIK